MCGSIRSAGKNIIRALLPYVVILCYDITHERRTLTKRCVSN